jgi:hypothetical protein
MEDSDWACCARYKEYPEKFPDIANAKSKGNISSFKSL